MSEKVRAGSYPNAHVRTALQTVQRGLNNASVAVPQSLEAYKHTAGATSDHSLRVFTWNELQNGLGSVYLQEDGHETVTEELRAYVASNNRNGTKKVLPQVAAHKKRQEREGDTPQND